MIAAANGRAAILTGRTKPARMEVLVHNLPPEIQHLERILGWNWEWAPHKNGGNGKWDKPPANCLGGWGSSTDPKTWCDLSTAVAAAEAGEVDGIGIALGKIDTDLVLCGVDLDDCRNVETGELTVEAQLIVRKVPIYWEVSPSGTGLKGLCYGSKPIGKCKTGNFEMFAGGKYFTLTGHALDGCVRQLVDATAELEWFHSTFISPPKPETPKSPTGDTPDRDVAIDALSGLSATRADDYAEWLCVGMALKSVSDDLLTYWDKWSQSSSKYSADECNAKWESFNGSGVGIGSLIHWAKEDGWKPEVKQENPFRGKVKYNILTCKDLANGDYTVEFLIDNALAALQPLIVGGPQKTLKTSVILDLAISLAVAGYFLGKLKVNRPVRVGVMTGESGLGTIQEQSHNICKAAGIWLDEITNLFFSEDLPKFGDVAHLEAVRDFITDYQLEVLVIDPAYLCIPSADAGNVFAQGELLRGMAEVCRDCRCMLVLCHHTKKNTGRDAFDVPELQDLAWSGFAEFCRQWWLLGRREKYEPGTGSHKLWLSIGGSAGHSALWAVDVEEGLRTDPSGRRWEVDIHAPNDAREQTDQRKEEAKAKRAADQLAEDVRKVLSTLAGFADEAGTKTDVKVFSGLRDSRLNPAIADALQSKYIVPFEVVKGNKQTYDGFKLNHPDAPG